MSTKPDQAQTLKVPVHVRLEMIAAQFAKAMEQADKRAVRLARKAEKERVRMQQRFEFDNLPETEKTARWDRLTTLLESQTWTFAKTMAANPHWYTVRKRWARDEDFVFCVEMIRLLGYVQRFKGSNYTVLDVNEYFYWTMGWPILSKDAPNATIIINRKPVTMKPTDADAERR